MGVICPGKPAISWKASSPFLTRRVIRLLYKEKLSSPTLLTDRSKLRLLSMNQGSHIKLHRLSITLYHETLPVCLNQFHWRMSFEEAVEINDIKSQPLSTCPFNILRGEMGRLHEACLLQTEVWWFPQGKALLWLSLNLKVAAFSKKHHFLRKNKDWKTVFIQIWILAMKWNKIWKWTK